MATNQTNARPLYTYARRGAPGDFCPTCDARIGPSGFCEPCYE